MPSENASCVHGRENANRKAIDKAIDRKRYAERFRKDQSAK